MRCFVRGFVLGRRDRNLGWSVFCPMEDCIALLQEGREGVLWKEDSKELKHR